jgi:hypothetical protein
LQWKTWKKEEKRTISFVFSTENKTDGIKGRGAVRSQIVMDNEIVNSLNYSGNLITYKEENRH